MAENNCSRIRAGVFMRNAVMNEQLVDGEIEGDHQKELDEELQPQTNEGLVRMWVKLLKDIWIGEEKKAVKEELCQSVLNQIFDGCENPMKTTLVLHKLCPDYGTQKASSLAGFVLRHFEQWLQKTKRNDELYRKLDRNLKIEAFAVGTSKHTIHLELITSIFQLETDDMMDYVLQAVKDMVVMANYRDAISCATLFRLQSHFTLNELVIPCMLQDRFIAVDAFIKNERKMQEELIRHFDNLIGLDERTIARRYEDFRRRKIMTISISRLQKKAIEKLVTKLLATYNIPPEEVAPNLSRLRREGALRHMAFMYFVEHRITEEGYFDYVAQALQSDLGLQKYFINYLCSNGWLSDAIRWVVFCDMINCAPRILQPYLCTNAVLEAQADLARMISKRASITNVELFPGHPIKVIANLEDLEELYPVIEEADLIGIDTEWKPLFMCTSERVALFQICVQHCSYLVDVITLENVLTEEQWTRFFKALFSYSTAIKLGFDFLNDLKVLRASFPYLQPLEEMKNVICILKLVKSLLASNPAFLDFSHSTNLPLSTETENLLDIVSDETVHFRLTDLCQKVLGQALDKTEQIGNWAMRPLRREQMKYAAMDGYCLLNLYNKLKIRAERDYNMDWTKHCKECDIAQIKSGENKVEKRTKKKGAKFDEKEFEQMIERVNSGLNNSQVKRKPKDLKVIVDSMILGLGKHLRRCGIDTILAETRSYLIECAERDPNRYIITCGKAVDELRRHRLLRGTHRVLSIPTAQNISIIQQIEFILRQFNIYLSNDDIFSRCMKCNSNSFVVAPSPVLEAMYQANIVASNPFSDEACDVAKYNGKMREADAEIHSGYECNLEVSESDHSWIVAHCHNGVLDIENCLVVALGCDMPVEVKIEKVPLQVLEKKGRFFYVCGVCGTVYWDGCHIVNYNLFVEPLLAEER
uniref:3'-5' exonuclease domain-containing protein n=1 Tax=Wuchereria bancrofti TaxID=6293 RepID=A0AAF5RXC1_WUCBA